MKKCPYLFPAGRECAAVSVGLLVLRVAFGALLLTHGWAKLSGFSAMSGQFPGVLGMGGALSLSLAIFAEFFCSIAFILGFLTRLAVIPMAFTMLVAFTTVHGCSIANGGELPLVYLAAFVAVWIAGPGRCSIDRLIAGRH